MTNNLKYISIDVETTGLDPDNNQLVEVAAIIDNLNIPTKVSIGELPSYHCYIKHDMYCGNPYALSLHTEKFKNIHNNVGNILTPEEFVYSFYNWIVTNNGYYEITNDDIVKIVGAGKNIASFDSLFLKNSHIEFNKHIKFAHRFIDVGNMYLRHTDQLPPDLDTCAIRAGLDEKNRVNHIAMNEVKMVIKLIRNYLNIKYTD